MVLGTYQHKCLQPSMYLFIKTCKKTNSSYISSVIRDMAKALIPLYCPAYNVHTGISLVIIGSLYKLVEKRYRVAKIQIC